MQLRREYVSERFRCGLGADTAAMSLLETDESHRSRGTLNREVPNDQGHISASKQALSSWNGEAPITAAMNCELHSCSLDAGTAAKFASTAAKVAAVYGITLANESMHIFLVITQDSI